MISAKEARDKLSKGNYEKYLGQISVIEQQISRAIERGHSECIVNFIVCGSVGTELIKQGYAFKSGCARNESYTTISW